MQNRRLNETDWNALSLDGRLEAVAAQKVKISNYYKHLKERKDEIGADAERLQKEFRSSTRLYAILAASAFALNIISLTFDQKLVGLASAVVGAGVGVLAFLRNSEKPHQRISYLNQAYSRLERLCDQVKLCEFNSQPEINPRFDIFDENQATLDSIARGLLGLGRLDHGSVDDGDPVVDVAPISASGLTPL